MQERKGEFWVLTAHKAASYYPFQGSQLVGKCANFCIYLIQYVKENPSSAVNAVEDFLRSVELTLNYIQIRVSLS